MSEYSEALEEVLENGGYLDNGKDDYKAPRLLKEAIDKAEKYDDILFLVRDKVDDINLSQSLLNCMLEESKSFGMVSRECKQLAKENEILKDGVKELIEFLEVCNLEHIYTGQVLDIKGLKANNKIKKMLEVLEND